MTPSVDHVIEAKGLERRYLKFAALNGVDFTIQGPTVLAVVGKNGSGKSTLLRILNGMEKPSKGTIAINGKAPYDNGKILRDIIFIDEKIEFDFTLSIGGILEKCAFMDKRFDLELALDMAKQFGLNLKKRQSQLSKGMRNQFGITVGLAINRPVTIMDEPISGLDESSRRLFYSLLVKSQCDNPRTFIVTTHLLGEFEKYADSFMVMNKGKLAAHDKREAFETLFVRVTGLQENVDKITDGLETYEIKTFADMKSVTVPNLLNREKKRFAEENNVEIRGVSVNDACVILGDL